MAHKPQHPGEFIRITYLDPSNVSNRSLAFHLDVAPTTINRIIRGYASISPSMALRLSKTLGRTPESWLAMQNSYDLFKAKKHNKLSMVKKLKLNH